MLVLFARALPESTIPDGEPNKVARCAPVVRLDQHEVHPALAVRI